MNASQKIIVKFYVTCFDFYGGAFCTSFVAINTRSMSKTKNISFRTYIQVARTEYMLHRQLKT